MLPKARSEVETYCGQPCIRLAIGDGDCALVALHGAQVLSWISGGRERLYLSPKAVFDGQAAIRGGIPLCFPQFNQRGLLREVVDHPGARPKPFMRPAFDGKAQAAIEAMAEYIRNRIPREFKRLTTGYSDARQELR